MLPVKNVIKIKRRRLKKPDSEADVFSICEIAVISQTGEPALT
jgi:hypothetical protein